ncbi:CHAT domain-containing protein [Desulfuromonas sp. AOP6]|uniref:CHAT domain-containing protein n=1 Tax=Desulfuromonas sp. AOP6 TaxID=1566351 RepID=UPI0012867557|nr:CHAT domain-containing protein [Desulfuromonas sp. AOP6]BCA79059.1 hypothetical protein AOP6_0846 [Desulfuromonas sp. AOP6]
MSFLDMYRRNVQRKNEEIAKFQKDKAGEQKKLAELSRKINAASQAMSRASSQSTIQSKLREIQRYQDDAARIEKKISDFEEKIARKRNELNQEEKKLAREEEQEIKKRQREADKQARTHEKRMKDISGTLRRHDQLHIETQSVLEQLKQLPEKIVVLYLAANPIDQSHLRLDEEARAIAEMIRKAKHRDAVKLESCWAIQPLDVLQALNEFQPAIVHFSGHGSDQDEIVFQDLHGNAKLVSKDAIVQTMMASSENIRLVFFNTCYSRNQAEAVVEHVQAAIGMKTSIGDSVARVFGAQFYSAIGFGLPVSKAFDQAKAAMMLEGIPEEDTPELFVKTGLNADEIILVRPPEGVVAESEDLE